MYLKWAGKGVLFGGGEEAVAPHLAHSKHDVRPSTFPVQEINAAVDDK